MDEKLLENHMYTLYQFLGHNGHYSRIGSLDTVTKAYENRIVKGYQEVLNYARLWNNKRNLFVGRAPRNSDGTCLPSRCFSLDIDPVRPKGEPSTDEQLNKVLEACKRIIQHYPGAYTSISGNGALLLWHCPNVGSFYDVHSLLIQDLQELVAEFNVKIDNTAYAEAVIKLLGSMSTKGSQATRRCSKFIDWPVLPYRTCSELVDKLNSLEAKPKRETENKTVTPRRLEDAQKLLQRLGKDKCNNYDEWLRVGMALKEFGDSGLNLWKEWSKQSEKYEEKACEKKWDTFDESPAVTLASVAYWVKQDSPNSQDREVDTRGSNSSSDSLESQSIEDFLKDIKPPKWICYPILAQGTIVFVAGLPETKKTWLLIDLAIQCAKGGGKWLGSYDVTAAKVLFIDQERYKGETQRRFKEVLRNLKISKLPGLEVMCGTTIRLDLDESYSAFRRKLEKIKPDVVIVDSFATFHTREENNRKDIQIVLERIKALRQEFGCTFIIVDHENKSVLNPEDNSAPSAFQMVGSVGKPAAAETVLTVRRNDDGSSTVYHTKSTISPTFGEIKFSVVDTDNGISVAHQR